MVVVAADWRNLAGNAETNVHRQGVRGIIAPKAKTARDAPAPSRNR